MDRERDERVQGKVTDESKEHIAWQTAAKSRIDDGEAGVTFDISSPSWMLLARAIQDADEGCREAKDDEEHRG